MLMPTQDQDRPLGALLLALLGATMLTACAARHDNRPTTEAKPMVAYGPWLSSASLAARFGRSI